MPVTAPIAPEQAPEGVKKIYDRIAETIGGGEVPAGFQMMGHVEPFLNDTYMNLRKYLFEGAGALDKKQRGAIALATSSANNCVHCVRHFAQTAAHFDLSAEEVAEVLAVTATCAMYNVYYKAKDLAGDEQLKAMQPQLRAHTFQKTSLDPGLAELINIVVSNINGCAMCTSGHLKKALDLGVTREQVDEALRLAGAQTAMNIYQRTQ